MPSQAGHDARYIAKKVPVDKIFIQSRDDLSQFPKNLQCVYRIIRTAIRRHPDIKPEHTDILSNQFSQFIADILNPKYNFMRTNPLRGKMIINPIKRRREKKGLTQANLALLLDVSQVYVSQFETGGLIPSNINIKKIVEILDLDKEKFNKEPRSYQAKKKELKKQIEEK